MTKKIGYFIPEFPGQTHIFFWREMQVLDQLGIETDLVSTRQPPTQIMSHTWAKEAQAKTTYLFPLPKEKIINIILELIRCGPIAWYRCLKAIVEAEGLSLSGRLRLSALVLIGAELSDIAKANKWHHLHVHSCADAAHIAMFASLLSNLSYSITLHGPLTDYGPNQKQKWRWAKLAIVITKKLYEEVHQDLAGYLPPEVKIAPMGVNLSLFTRQTPYRPWDGQNAALIFSCGRLNPCKGHADLIKAIDLLQKQGINAKLAIAGEDEKGGIGYHQDLSTLIQQLNLTNSVQLLGAVSEEIVKQKLQESHIFALASWHEPLGVAIMEAMAIEIPVVVTGTGGVKELVDDGIDGILVNPESAEELAEAMKKILQNPDLALKLSQKSREKIASQFSDRVSAEVIVKMLEKMT